MLGLDIGTRRIGIALSNALGFASPLLTLERTQPRSDQRSILRLARRHHCAGIVAGHPLRLSGAPSQQTARVLRFLEQLQALMQQQAAAASPDGSLRPRLPVYLWDERLSTVAAQEALAASRPGTSPKMAPAIGIDALAASVILQGWLDHHGGAALLPSETGNIPVV